MELGRSLIDYCKAKEEEQAEAMKEIGKKLEALEKHLDSQPGNQKKGE